MDAGQGGLGTGPRAFQLIEPHVTSPHPQVLTEPELWVQPHLGSPVEGGSTLLGEVTLGRVLQDEQELADQTQWPPCLISHTWPLPPSPWPCEVLSSSPRDMRSPHAGSGGTWWETEADRT